MRNLYLFGNNNSNYVGFIAVFFTSNLFLTIIKTKDLLYILCFLSNRIIFFFNQSLSYGNFIIQRYLKILYSTNIGVIPKNHQNPADTSEKRCCNVLITF